MQIKELLKIYAALLLLHLAALYVNEPGGLLIKLSKPLLLLSLLAFVLHAWGTTAITHKQLLIRALAFSLLGDVFLMFSGQWFFWGLGAFLLAQTQYLMLFLKFRKPLALADGLILMLLLGIGGVVLWPLTLPDATWMAAVYGYALVLILMVWSTWLMRHLASKTIFFSLISGAILFLISDALLAQQLFDVATPTQKIAVMFTYGLAQWGLFWGSMQLLEQANPSK
jgi:uncharacterized membrane protein YhhN